MNPDLLKRPVVLAAVAAILIGAAASVLYVIHSAPVHAPPALAELVPAKTPVPAPAVAFTDGLGKRHTLSEFRGRYVLLNLWATWCGPCVKELPALQRLQAAMPADRFAVVPVNVGRSDALDTAKFLMAHNAAKLSVNVDTDLAVMRAFHAYGLPATILIDPQGREIARAEGPAGWDDPAAIAYFKSLAAHAAS